MSTNSPSSKADLVFVCALTALFVFAWKIQAHLFLNRDVSWLLIATQRLLGGESYTAHFWETNPPLIMYLYAPPVLLSEWYGLKLSAEFRVYFFLLAAFSLSLCEVFLRGLFKGQGRKPRGLFLLLLAAIFLLLPSAEFGQRDHLLLILTMPYFLGLAYRLEARDNHDLLFSFPRAEKSIWLLTGLLAALGFALKPHFLAAFFLVELYYFLSQQKPRAWQRSEIQILLVLWLSYAASVLVFHLDYLHTIIPYALRYYYQAVALPWSALLFAPTTLFGYLTLFMYFLLERYNPYKALGRVLCLALVGFIFSFITQRTLFHYHLLPPLSFGLLLNGLLFFALAQNPITPRRLLLACLAAFVFIAAVLPSAWTTATLSPVLYFNFFLLLFCTLLFLSPQDFKLWQAVLLLALVIGAAIYTRFLALHLPWHSHLFLLVTAVLFLGFASTNARLGLQPLPKLALALLGMLVFSFPLLASFNLTEQGLAARKGYPQSPLLLFLQKEAAGQGVYFFMASPAEILPATEYAESKLVSRFYFLWPISGIANQTFDFAKTGSKPTQLIHDQHYFTQLIAEDLRLYKPRFVIVDSSTHKASIHDPAFDYLRFFSRNEDFQRAWKAYTYLTTLEDRRNYKLAVYYLKNA